MCCRHSGYHMVVVAMVDELHMAQSLYCRVWITLWVLLDIQTNHLQTNDDTLSDGNGFSSLEHIQIAEWGVDYSD